MSDTVINPKPYKGDDKKSDENYQKNNASKNRGTDEVARFLERFGKKPDPEEQRNNLSFTDDKWNAFIEGSQNN